MIKVFLDELPKHTNGTYKGCIDWTNSIGKNLRFKYEEDEILVDDFMLIKDYNKNSRKVKLEYNGKVLEISVSSLRDGWIKNIIGAKIKTTAGNFADFKIQIGERIIDENRDLTILDRKRVNSQKYQYRKMYKYKCNICGYDDGWLEECDILHHKIGCSCCSKMTIVPGINDIPTTDPWMVDYFQGGYEEAKQYTAYSAKRIIPICPICKRIKSNSIMISQIKQTHSIGCTCRDGISYPEKFFINFLEQLGVNFIYQLTKTTFKWVGNYHYDFYLPDYNCIIETHGGQHYKDTTWSSSSTTNNNDNNKMERALNNGIFYYIQLDCSKSTKEFISNSILSSALSNILNLKDYDINWEKCSEFACRNITKDICNFYVDNNYNIDMTSKQFHLSRTAIGRYLKLGNDLGWCIYPFHSYRKIVVQKDDEYIGCFDSSKYIEDNSIEIFGIYLGQTQIIHNCNKNKNGFTKPYKGYYFITEYDYNNVICESA